MNKIKEYIIFKTLQLLINHDIAKVMSNRVRNNIVRWLLSRSDML
jgi:hypothetical protein